MQNPQGRRGPYWVRVIRSLISKSYVQSDLNYILSQADPQAPLDVRLDWLDSLLEWIRLPVSPRKRGEELYIESARIKFFLQILERYPSTRERAAATLRSIVRDSDFTDFFSETGIQIHYSFTKELLERLLSPFIPSYRDPKSFKQTFDRIIRNQEDLDWLSSLDDPTLDQLIHLFVGQAEANDEMTKGFFKSLIAANKILTVRVTSLSLDRELKTRLPEQNPVDSPFFKLSFVVAEYDRLPMDQLVFAKVRELVDRCRQQVMMIYPMLEDSGLTIDLVYKLDTINILLRRVERLNEILRQLFESQPSSDYLIPILLDMAAQNLEKTNLVPFLGANVNLIARKLVERTSETGEHYIARTPSEYREMFLSAGGGGLVTVLTTVFKAAIGKLGLPLFIEGVATGLNYAISFLVIHFSHFTLATKTPAMTASTLAGRLKNLDSPSAEKAFVEEVVHLVRSAAMAVLGNLGLVIPGAILFDVLFHLLSGRHVFSAPYGLEQIGKHNPFTSLTILYAGITGFILWFSSIIGPWVENWFVYRRFFEMLERSRSIRDQLGPSLQQTFVGGLRRHMAAVCTNVALGFLLGFAGIFGSFFGLPIQVRHVTLSAGTLAFSLIGVPNLANNLGLVVISVISLLMIGLLNFGVSFSLSLFVAARARNIQLRMFPHLIRLIARRLFLPTGNSGS